MNSKWPRALESKLMYSSVLLDHFEHPRNVGELDPADVRVTVENPACGDVMLLTLKVREGKIADARYRTKGCVASIACGSRLTEMIIGRSPAEARDLDRDALAQEVRLTAENMHASHLVFDALAAALKQLK